MFETGECIELMRRAFEPVFISSSGLSAPFNMDAPTRVVAATLLESGF